MKKILCLLILILAFDNVYAENILDNYTIKVKIEGTKVHIIEKFDTVSVDDINYIKESFINLNNYELIKSNIENFAIIDEQNYHFRPFFTGIIKPNKSYIIEYSTDFDIFGTGAYSFDSPNSTIINNLTFRIEYNELIYSVGVYGYNERLYETIEDGNLIIGRLSKKTSDASFRVNAWKYIEISDENDEYKKILVLDSIIVLVIFVIPFVGGTIFVILYQKGPKKWRRR